MKKILIPAVVFVSLWVIAGLIMNRYALFAQEEDNVDIWDFQDYYAYMHDDDLYPMWVILHLDQDEIDIYYENLAEAMLLSDFSTLSVEEGIIRLRELRREMIDDVNIDRDGYYQGGMTRQRSYLGSCHQIYRNHDLSYPWLYLHLDHEKRDEMDQALVIELQVALLSTLTVDQLYDLILATESNIVATYLGDGF